VGLALALDDELLPPQAPALLVAADGTFGAAGPGAGGGVEARFGWVALRAGSRVDAQGSAPAAGGGVTVGNIELDYALAFQDVPHHTITAMWRGLPKRPRALALLRQARDEARQKEREALVAEVRATTGATYAGQGIDAARARAEALPEAAGADLRARAGRLLDQADAALGEGDPDRAWSLAVETDSVVAEALERMQVARDVGDARSGRRAPLRPRRAAPTTPAPATAGPRSASTPDAMRRARAFLLEGLGAYRQGDYDAAVAGWTRARDAAWDLPGIDGYLANAEAKAKAMAAIRARGTMQ
jgi:hypothetical protein